MPVVALIVGAILIITAFQGTHVKLAQALEQDVPGFFRWAAAIAAVIGLGYIPGLERPSRWLLGLVVLVIVLKNYTGIFAGFSNFAGTGSTTAQQSAASEQQSAQQAAAAQTQASNQLASLAGQPAQQTGNALAAIGGVAGGVALGSQIVG